MGEPHRARAVDAWVALGANLGDAAATLRHAVGQLHALADTRVVKISSLYRTAPIDAQGPDFYNAVVQIRTALSALDLLHALQTLEQEAGRQRPYRNAPRTLDLDILLYGSTHWQDAALTLPHPRMYARAFVLAPLAEISPEKVTAAQLAGVQTQAIEKITSSWVDLSCTL